MHSVTMTLFDGEGVFHSYSAEIVTEDEKTVTINMPLRSGRCHQTHCKKTGLFLHGAFRHLPKHVMMSAKNPTKDSFLHLKKSKGTK